MINTFKIISSDHFNTDEESDPKFQI